MPKAAHPTRHNDRWRIRWIDHTGKRCSELHESYSEAEDALARHQTAARAVRKGERAAPAPLKTFNELADDWLEHRRDKRSLDDDRSIIKRLRAAFGPMALPEIDREQVDQYQRAQERRGSRRATPMTTSIRPGPRPGRDRTCSATPTRR